MHAFDSNGISCVHMELWLDLEVFGVGAPTDHKVRLGSSGNAWNNNNLQHIYSWRLLEEALLWPARPVISGGTSRVLSFD